MNQPPAHRVRVTGPPRRTTRRRARSSEIDDQTVLGTVLMESLLRAQLRLAFVVLAPLAIFAIGLPLAFYLFPHLGDIRLIGAPLAILALGVLIYPGLLVLGWAYVRRAERHERDFAELLETSEPE